MALEQKYLNVTTRAEAYMEMIMFIPDNSISISKISSDDLLSYSNIDSIGNIKNYTSTTIATLEENLWLLNGSFINPTAGRTYNGYISNSMSDDNGDFETNPVITVDLKSSSDVENFTIIMNPAVKSGYAREVIVSFLDSEGNILNQLTKIIAEEKNLPNLVFEVNTPNVKQLIIEFIGTQFKHRRIRISTLMFGKAIKLTDEEILNTDYLDRCSYVPDSIPSRTFTLNVENYDKRYNIDNPNNDFVDLDRQTRLMFRNGYNVFGYTEKPDGTAEIINPDNAVEKEWDDWKELRLIDIFTNDDNTATFEFGSILDIMTDIYTQETFINDRTVRYIVEKLLDFMALGVDIVSFSSDENGKSYGDYVINTALPELPVRELLQLLAFSVGATLLIKDNGTIEFANLDIDRPASFNKNHSFTYTDFTSIPEAQQLENTDKISLPKYNSSIGKHEEKIQTLTVGSNNVEISYMACVPTKVQKSESDNSQATVQSSELFCRRGNVVLNMPVEENVDIDVLGYKIETSITQERSMTKDSLVIETQLMKEDPQNLIKNKYKKWYAKKFKYTMDTRGEPLVNAGDYAKIQTPFGSEIELLDTYVLQNHVKFDGTWSGDMEVIAL